jgi:hypothetical protein
MDFFVHGAHFSDPSSVAEDARGDPFPAKLAVIAERDDGLWVCGKGAKFVV